MPTDDAERALAGGARFPYDAPDSWWHSNDEDGSKAPPATDWAHAAARGVMTDLNDRSGIKHGFRGIDEEIRVEITLALAEIIRAAWAQRKV